MEPKRIHAGAQRNAVNSRNLKRGSLGSRHCIRVLEDLWPGPHSQVLSMDVRRVKRTCGTPTHSPAPIPMPDSYAVSCSLPLPPFYALSPQWCRTTQLQGSCLSLRWSLVEHYLAQPEGMKQSCYLSFLQCPCPWVILSMMFSDARQVRFDFSPGSKGEGAPSVSSINSANSVFFIT